MRISWLLARRVPDVPSPLLVEVAGLLRDVGHTVDGWVPEDEPGRTGRVRRARPDLLVLKSHTEPALRAALEAARAGIPTLEPCSAYAATQDKDLTTRLLAGAGCLSRPPPCSPRAGSCSGP